MGIELTEPPPAIRPEEASDYCLNVFAVAGKAFQLGGERDANFKIEGRDGRNFILKFSNPGEDAASILGQTRAMVHLEGKPAAAVVQGVARTRSGGICETVALPDGRKSMARMLEVV